MNFKDSLAFIDVMHYPNNNCATGANAVVPQDVFPNYLNHHNVQNVVTPYASTAQISLAAGKQLMMMETNTASCGVRSPALLVLLCPKLTCSHSI